MIYLLDANVLITAYRVHYQIDFCPAFWDWLTKSYHNQRVYSVQRVLAEISVKDDKLREWIRTLGKKFFLPPSKHISKNVEEISKFILENDYKPSEKKIFRRSRRISHCALDGEPCNCRDLRDARRPQKSEGQNT